MNEATVRLLTNALKCAAKADPKDVRAAYLKYYKPQTPSQKSSVPPSPVIQRVTTAK